MNGLCGAAFLLRKKHEKCDGVSLAQVELHLYVGPPIRGADDLNDAGRATELRAVLGVERLRGTRIMGLTHFALVLAGVAQMPPRCSVLGLTLVSVI